LLRIEADSIATFFDHMRPRVRQRPQTCAVDGFGSKVRQCEQNADFLLEVLDRAFDPSHKDCFGETPKPTRETRALPRTAALLHTGRELFVIDISNFALCPRPSI
jgi:hypothetical protein